MQHFLDRNPQDLSVSLSLLQKSLISASDNRHLEEENTFQKLLTAVGSFGGQFVEDLTAGPTIMINSVQTALTQQAAEMTRNIGDIVAVGTLLAVSLLTYKTWNQPPALCNLSKIFAWLYSIMTPVLGTFEDRPSSALCKSSLVPLKSTSSFDQL